MKQGSRLDSVSDSVTGCSSLLDIVIGSGVGVSQSNSQSGSIIVSNSEPGLSEVVVVVEGEFREKASEPLSSEVSALRARCVNGLGYQEQEGYGPLLGHRQSIELEALGKYAIDSGEPSDALY